MTNTCSDRYPGRVDELPPAASDLEGPVRDEEKKKRPVGGVQMLGVSSLNVLAAQRWRTGHHLDVEKKQDARDPTFPW